MNGKIVILGYGPVGRAATEILARRGADLRVAQRSAPKILPAGVKFVACDILDADSVRAACEGAAQVVLAIGFAYDGAVWRKSWPRAVDNTLEACAANGARLVFFDNLYMYGPQNAPMTEATPLADYGVKPAVRAAITRVWMAASQAGRVKVAAVRAPDFYGPGVGLTVLGDSAFGALAKGKTALYVGSADLPHDFAYVPDCGRAVVSLLDAPDDAFGRAWHVPCAPTRTAREILTLAAVALGRPLRLQALPLWALRPLSLFVPDLRGVVEMRFNWDRPYYVDASDFRARFWSDPTPFEIGVPATAKSFMET